MSNVQFHAAIMPKSRRAIRKSVSFRRVVVEDDGSVGQILAAARSAAGRTLAGCARKLRVPEDYLCAIESEDFNKLPGLVYEKHFVGRYARLLGLTPAPLIDSWVGIRQLHTTHTPATDFSPQVRWWDLRSTPLVWRRIFAVAVILVLASYVGIRLIEVVAPPALEVTSPLAGTVAVSPEFVVSGTVAEGSTLVINGQMVVAAADGVFAVPVRLTPGPNTIRVVAEKRDGRNTVVERQIFLASTSAEASEIDVAQP